MQVPVTIETHELPPNREGLLALIRELLERGGVQKIMVEIGQPIYVERALDGSEGPPVDTSFSDLYAAVMNAEMVDFTLEEGVSPLGYIYQANRYFFSKDLVVTDYLVRNIEDLRKWLQVGVMDDLSRLMGTPVTESREVPEGTLIVVGSIANLTPRIVKKSLRLDISQ